MGIIDIQTKQMRKIMQELIDNSFAYMKTYNEGSSYQKTVTTRRLLKSLEAMHAFLEPTGKISKLKPQRQVTTYSTGSKLVHIIQKPDSDN